MPNAAWANPPLLLSIKTIEPVSQLRCFLEALPRHLVASPIVLACSGGPDSMALVIAASQLRLCSRFAFVVAHVNHKLRGKESDKDNLFVVQASKKMEIKAICRVCPVSKTASGNLEETARDKRYAALVQIAERQHSQLVLTAHTQNDQAETVFMNFLRGTGADGLAGIAPLRPLSKKVQLGRPFLIFEREELHRWSARFGMRSRRDRSNGDIRLLRNWLRGELLPQLESRSPGFNERLAQMATLFQDEKTFWADFLTDLGRRVSRSYRGGRLLDLGGLLRYSAAVQRRFLRRAVGENLLMFDAVERLRNWMMSPPTGGRKFQLRLGWTVTRLSKSQGAPSAKLFLIKDENS